MGLKIALIVVFAGMPVPVTAMPATSMPVPVATVTIELVAVLVEAIEAGAAAMSVPPLMVSEPVPNGPLAIAPVVGAERMTVP